MSDAAPIVDAAEFTAMVSSRARSLLDLAGRLGAADVIDVESALELLTRPRVAVIHSEAAQLEEVLDAYGALGSERWRPFRGVVAAMKLFARVHYSLLHLAHAAPHYRLLCEEAELATVLLRARRFTARVLQTASRRLVEARPSLGLDACGPVEIPEELLPPGRLPQDCALRRVDDVAETVARLATAFLHLAGEVGPLASASRGAGESESAPSLPTESQLRVVAEDFHNLQALYDTHVARTDAERDDPELLSLRGHASVVYHLLDVTTELTHHRERHVLHAPADGRVGLFAREPGCLDPEELESVLRDALKLSARYVLLGRTLAQQLLRRYADRGEVTVAVPRYRGFHVRPSTLVARIVHHYGSAVSMTLEGESYDASSPMELFRANEAINAKKRRWLAQEIGRLVNGSEAELGQDVVRAVRSTLMRLAEEAKVILYEQPLPPIDGQPADGRPVLAFVVDAVARLQALGKIDIVTTVTATFRGDRRVLRDVELLAANGYGEDAYGNNIALPAELAYLRR